MKKDNPPPIKCPPTCTEDLLQGANWWPILAQEGMLWLHQCTVGCPSRTKYKAALISLLRTI